MTRVSSKSSCFDEEERYTFAMSMKTLSSREVYRNNWMTVREDEIERPSGAKGIYGVVDKHPCAVIIPLDGDQLHFVEQFRYTVQKTCVEFPQGGWETADVNMEELARGELREETGFLAETMVYLGPLYVAYGFANQLQHVFLATGLTAGPTEFDPEEEDLVLRTIPVKTFEQMLLRHEISDCCTIAAWGLYKIWKEHTSAGA